MCRSHAIALQQMAELFFLGLHVERGDLSGVHDNGYALDHPDACCLDRGDFVRVIREQAHRFYAERFQNVTMDGKVPQIGLKAKLLVRFHGIRAVVLKLVGPDLVHQADTAPFFLLIDHHAPAFFGDPAKRHFELGPAIAAETVEHVAGQALRMDAHKRRRSRVQVSHPNGNQFLLAAIHLGFDAVDLEISELRGEVRLRNQLYFYGHVSIRRNSPLLHGSNSLSTGGGQADVTLLTPIL